MEQSSTLTSDRKQLSPWLVLVILCSLAFLNYFDRNLIFPLMGLIAKELNTTNTELGMLGTGFQVVYALSGPTLGWLADRVSRKKIMLICLVVWTCATALSGLATGFLSLLVWRSLTGLGEGGYFPIAVSTIGDSFPQRLRGRAVAIHGLFATLGGSVGYGLGGILGEHFGWRRPFFLTIVPAMLASTVVAIWFPRSRSEDQNAQTTKAIVHRGRPYFDIVLAKPVLFISLAACLAAFSMNGITTFFPKYLQDHSGWSVAGSGIWTGILYSITIVGQLSGGWLSDKAAQRDPALRALLVALPYVLAMVGLCLIPIYASVVVACVLFGITQLARGFAEPNMYASVMDTVASEERATAQGFMIMWTFAGAALSPSASGYLIEHYGYSHAFFMLAIAALLSSLAALNLYMSLRREHSIA